MTHPLSQYKNLADWAVRAYALEDTPSLPAQKDAALVCLNKSLGTNYSRVHIDNWLAGRKKTPASVFKFWFETLIEAEIEIEDPELGREIKRLFKS